MVVVPAGSFTMGSPRHERGRDYNEGPQHDMRPAAELCPASIHDSGSAMTKRTCCRYGNGGDQETSVSEAMTMDRMGRAGPDMTGSFIRRRPGISSRTVSVCTTCSALLSDGRRNNYKGAPADGSVWMRPNCRDFVLRGSSWNNPPMYLRVAYRAGGGLSRTDGTGLRVARTLTP